MNTNLENRDSEASAPPEFPPEQPEADLQPDDEEYGADELEEDAEEEGAEAAAENAAETSAAAVAADGDAEMAGVEEPAEEDELSDEGSVDLENESEDELDRTRCLHEGSHPPCDALAETMGTRRPAAGARTLPLRPARSPPGAGSEARCVCVSGCLAASI